MATQREASRQNWTSENTREDINSGSLQRMADALEKIAGNTPHKKWLDAVVLLRKAISGRGQYLPKRVKREIEYYLNQLP